MLKIAPALPFALLLPVALHAEQAMCEYRNPGHASWDFFAPCEVTETVTGEGTRREAKVSNGSRFTTVTGGASASVNGHAARAFTQEGADCWRTEAENELICIYPADTVAPAAPAPAMVQSGPSLGGEKGYCLLVSGGVAEAYGPCLRRENCLEMDGAETGGMTGTSCLAEYDWASGRQTETARAENWLTLDGAPASTGDNGCVFDAGDDVTFCFSKAAMTAASYPALATLKAQASPAPAPEGEGGAN